MDSIGSFDKMKLVVMYNPEDSQEDKTECIIKKFMRLPKQRVMQLYRPSVNASMRWVVIPGSEALDLAILILIPHLPYN
jgi:hypothetical protein